MRGFLSKSEYYTIFVFYPLIRTGPVFGEQANRDGVTKAFTSEKVKEVIKKRGIELISYRELKSR